MKKIERDLVNSLIAGGLVFAGAFINGGLDMNGIIAALAASVIVFLTNFRDKFNNVKVKGKRGEKTIFQFV